MLLWYFHNPLNSGTVTWPWKQLKKQQQQKNNFILFYLWLKSVSFKQTTKSSKQCSLTLSREFPKLTVHYIAQMLLILLLSIGCPLIHEHSTNSHFSATASTQPLLFTWVSTELKIYKPTLQLCFLVFFLHFHSLSSLWPYVVWDLDDLRLPV